MIYAKRVFDYFKLINEGVLFKDKFIIFLYFTNTPINLIKKCFKMPYSRKLIGNVTLKNKDGIFFCGKHIFNIWSGSDSYEKELRDYFNIKKGIFVDIGANLGKYSVIVGRQLNKKGEVVAIEPHPYNFRMLKKNIKLNKLDNVILKKMACSKSKDILDLYLDEVGLCGGGGHSLVKKMGNNKISVKVDTLDNILKELGIKKIDLIKIDVEGAEVDVLKGTVKTLKRYHPKIIFEAWNNKCLKKVEEVLYKFNYKIKKINDTNYFAH